MCTFACFSQFFGLLYGPLENRKISLLWEMDFAGFPIDSMVWPFPVEGELPRNPHEHLRGQVLCFRFVTALIRNQLHLRWAHWDILRTYLLSPRNPANLSARETQLVLAPGRCGELGRSFPNALGSTHENGIPRIVNRERPLSFNHAGHSCVKCLGGLS